MNFATIFLVILIIIANATLDEIRFHWSRLFGHWIPTGHKLEKWFNPSISWKNKYFTSRFLTFLFSTLLVWTTDFWHLLKFVIINSILFILIDTSVKGKLMFGAIDLEYFNTLDYIIAIVMLNVAWGIVYEFTSNVYASISDRYINTK